MLKYSSACRNEANGRRPDESTCWHWARPGTAKSARLDVRERAEVLLWQPVDHRQQLADVD